MLSMNDLRPGVLIDLEGEPYQVLESNFNKVAQRRPVMQTKIRNVITGKVRSETFQQSDSIKEAEIERLKSKFTYRTKNEFFFQTEGGDPSTPLGAGKMGFTEEILGDKINYLKKDTPVDIFVFKDKPISLELPIKVILEVKDAPPAARGDTVQGAMKDAILETGAEIKVPLFIEAGEKIEVDTRTGTYVRRAQEE